MSARTCLHRRIGGPADRPRRAARRGGGPPCRRERWPAQPRDRALQARPDLGAHHRDQGRGRPRAPPIALSGAGPPIAIGGTGLALVRIAPMRRELS